MAVLELVGPKGFIHGWIHVGAPAVGSKVAHPSLGQGTVTSHGDHHVTVRFAGGEHSFQRGHSKGAPRLEKAAASAPEVKAAAPKAPEPAIVPRPEQVREFRKYPVSALREALSRPADKIGPQRRSEIQAALDEKTRKGRPAHVAGSRDPLAADSYKALEPRRGGWTTTTRAKTLDALKKDPNGAAVATVLNSFQQGGSTAIPRLRTDIEKAAGGGNLPEGRQRAVDALLGAIAGSDASGKHLYRGAVIPGSAAEVAAKYKQGSSIHISLGSFTSDKKVGHGFSTPEGQAGQRIRAKVTTPVVLDWGQGDKRALPIENLGKSGVFANEREWLSSGEFRIVGTKDVNGTLYLMVEQVKPL